eukprot:gene4894-6103_t
MSSHHDDSNIRSSDIDSTDDNTYDDEEFEDEIEDEKSTKLTTTSTQQSSSNNNNKSTTTTTTTTSTPTTATTSTTSNASTLRSKVEILADIEELLQEKNAIESKLTSLEKQIYALEGRYLEETHHIGNVIRGWDGYASGSGALKKLRWRESDRIFSYSSVTAQDAINDKSAPDYKEDIITDEPVNKKRNKIQSTEKVKNKKNI